MASSSTCITVGVPKCMDKTCTTYKEHLGNDIFLTVGLFNGDKVVGIRKFEDNDKGESHPKPAGVTMSPGRFASLIFQVPNIDKMYAYVQQHRGKWRTIHIGGEMYASASHDFKQVNLRQFYKLCKFTKYK